MRNIQLQQDNQVIESLDEFAWIAKNLPIRFFGDQSLNTKCKTVEPADFGGEELKEMVQALLKTLTQYRAHTGVGRGLAANQLGITKRIIVVWLGDEPEAFINPRQISAQGSGSYWETCISSGAFIIGEVIRPWKGIFEFQDITGETHRVNADEKQTRLFLHEMDHLEGLICSERYEKGTTRFVRGGKKEILGYPFTKLS